MITHIIVIAAAFLGPNDWSRWAPGGASYPSYAEPEIEIHVHEDADSLAAACGPMRRACAFAPVLPVKNSICSIHLPSWHTTWMKSHELAHCRGMRHTHPQTSLPGVVGGFGVAPNLWQFGDVHLTDPAIPIDHPNIRR